MSRKPCMPVLFELVRAYQAFELYSGAHIRTLGLTSSQFDIIATLGNTEGMNFKDLGEKTLITKGTLTGVVDRLEAKALVRRVASTSDGRSQMVELTRSGKKMFCKIFPAHISQLEQVFTSFSKKNMGEIQVVLHQLHQAFAVANLKLQEES